MWVNNIHEKETFLIIKTSFVIYEIKGIMDLKSHDKSRSNCIIIKTVLETRHYKKKKVRVVVVPQTVETCVSLFVADY